MNKPELEEEVKRLTKEVETLTKNNSFLIKEQKKYVGMATEAGSQLAPYKHMVTRLQEEMNKLPSLKNK